MSAEHSTRPESPLADVLDAVRRKKGQRAIAEQKVATVTIENDEGPNRVVTLSPREQEVLKGVISGRLNKQIAGDLGITEKSVKAHRARVMEKLHVRSVAGLVRFCAEVGITPQEVPFHAIHHLPAGERIEIIKRGVEAEFVPTLAQAMGTSKEALLNQLGISRATVDRKIRENKRLSRDESQRVVGMAKLIGLVQAMVDGGDGAGDFDAAKWLARWVDEPAPALGGRKPSEFLDTAEGQELVANTLRRMESGAYG